jgi:hypothetical protein
LGFRILYLTKTRGRFSERSWVRDGCLSGPPLSLERETSRETPPWKARPLISPVGTTRVYDLDGVMSGYVAYPTFRFSGPVFPTTAEGPTCGRWGGAKGQSLSLAKAAPERPA